MEIHRRKITITKRDIKRGIPECPEACPIALAIKRTMRAKSVEVEGGDLITIVKRTKLELEETWNAIDKTIVDQFITRFDRGEKDMEPFEIEIAYDDEPEEEVDGDKT